MKKFLILLLILIAPKAFAYDGYVSPESYAVNEADLMDYRYIPPSPKLNLEMLEAQDKQPQYKQEVKHDSLQSSKQDKVKKEKHVKTKKIKDEDPDAYKKRLSYKFAKWWVDQRYKREEVHHGTKHEIKVHAREEYEKRLQEQASQQDEQ